MKIAVSASAVLLSLTAWAQQDQQPQADPQPTQPSQAEPQRAEPMKSKTDSAPAGSMAKLGRDDKAFVMEAAIGGLAEVEMGKLAADNAVSREVKDFGERMVTDHEKANKDLEQAVAPYGVILPTKVDDVHQRHLDMLKAKKGADFDRAFTRHMVEGHEKMVKLFKKEARSGQAAPVKEFATNTLPTLQEHLKIAKDLAKAKTSSRWLARGRRSGDTGS